MSNAIAVYKNRLKSAGTSKGSGANSGTAALNLRKLIKAAQTCPCCCQPEPTPGGRVAPPPIP